MFVDMQRRHHWVLPTHYYDTPEQLIADLNERVIRRVEVIQREITQCRQLVEGIKRAGTMGTA
jgi:hypothetical protein